MPGISKETLALLQYLLPGFLAATVIYASTSHKRTSQFEQAVQALILSAIVQMLTSSLKFAFLWLGSLRLLGMPWGQWTLESATVVSPIVAIALGALLAAAMNQDWVYRVLRKIKFTSRSSYPSTWYEALHDHPTYITLHLKDGRRLMGWPKTWASDPTDGHFLLEQAIWLAEPDVPLVTGSLILVNAADVELIEFFPKEQNDGNPQPSPAGTPAGTNPLEGSHSEGSRQRESSGSSEQSASAPPTRPAEETGVIGGKPNGL